MEGKKKKLAYLAPELPALSATFVYNEILALEKKGYDIITYSVHQPQHPVQNEEVSHLLKNTEIIYSRPFIQLLAFFVINIFKWPVHILMALRLLINDVISVIKTPRNAFSLIWQFFTANFLAFDLNKKNVEHLHIHFCHVPTQIGMYATEIAGIPFSFMMHANDIFERGLLLKEKIRRAKTGVTISEYNRCFLTRLGINKGDVQIVRCGIKKPDPNNSSFKQAARVSQGTHTPIIGTIGRLVEKKGMDKLIKAAAKLKEQNIPFKLEIAGDGPLREGLEELAFNLNLNGSITFLGSMDNNAVNGWMKDLDIFALALPLFSYCFYFLTEIRNKVND